MAYGRKTGGRNFQKGCKPGPGAPKIPEDQKLAWAAIVKMRRDATFLWNKYYDELGKLPQAELMKFVGDKQHPPDPKIPVLKLLIARGILKQMSFSRASDLQIHREMMCGPEPKQIELSGPGGEPLSPMSNLSQEKLAKAFAALDRIVKEAECPPQTLSSQSSQELPAPPSLPLSGGES